MRCCFLNTAAFTAIARYQPPLLRIETLVLQDNPLVKTPFAQGLAFSLCRGLWFFEAEDVSHSMTGGQQTASSGVPF